MCLRDLQARHAAASGRADRDMPGERAGGRLLAAVVGKLAERGGDNVRPLTQREAPSWTSGMPGWVVKSARRPAGPWRRRPRSPPTGRRSASSCRPAWPCSLRMPLPPDVRAGKALEHRNDRLALLISDGVERLVGLLDGADGLDDRVRRRKASSAIACSRSPTWSMSPPQSGWKCWVVLFAIQLAKPSFSQRSSHHAMVTRSPNHMCAISCASMLKMRLLVGFAADRRIEQQRFSKVKIAPQFSIAPKNSDWPGPATLSSLGRG